MPQELMIDAIKVDYEIQSRLAMCPETLSEYVSAWESRAIFPPVVVFNDGEKMWLSDGFHRLQAATLAGLVHIQAEVREGSRRDAILYALGANANHGLRRTDGDKRKCIKTLLADAKWSKMPAKRIATLCCVDGKLVETVQQSFLDSPPVIPPVVRAEAVKIADAGGKPSYHADTPDGSVSVRDEGATEHPGEADAARELVMWARKHYAVRSSFPGVFCELEEVIIGRHGLEVFYACGT